MQYRTLGTTGFSVSELCFGALPIGPLQAGLSPEEGGALIFAGLKQGINFIDTAEVYRTYAHLKWALDRWDGEVVVASKATGTTYQAMKDSVAQALQELGRDRIEIFNLHASRDPEPLTNRAGALEALLELKEQGTVGAVGVTTHSVLGVRQAASDPRVDIVFPLINRIGLGIVDGGIPEMLDAIRLAQRNGKGVFAMKALAGGNLISEIKESIDFVRQEAGVPVIAVGMVRPVELAVNLAIFQGQPLSEQLLAESKMNRKQAKVLFLCKGCGQCVTLCHNDAIQMVNGKAEIDHQKCLICGYCSRECPQFAIRIV